MKVPRRVIGWAVAAHLGASLAVEALRMALAQRQPAPGLIHHSDRGIQYDLRGLPYSAGRPRTTAEHEPCGQSLRQRQGRIFHEDAEEEQVRGNQWRDLHALRDDLARFLQITYNHQRLHSALDYQTPAAFESSCSLRTSASI